MSSQSSPDRFISDIINSLDSALDEKLRAEAECKRLRMLFLSILVSTASQMMYGDFARRCAERALYPNEPEKWIYGKGPQ